MGWAVHVARMWRREMRTEFWSEILEGRDHSEELGLDASGSG